LIEKNVTDGVPDDLDKDTAAAVGPLGRVEGRLVAGEADPIMASIEVSIRSVLSSEMTIDITIISHSPRVFSCGYFSGTIVCVVRQSFTVTTQRPSRIRTEKWR
jgi:hypothetical protein